MDIFLAVDLLNISKFEWNDLFMTKNSLDWTPKRVTEIETKGAFH